MKLPAASKRPRRKRGGQNILPPQEPDPKDKDSDPLERELPAKLVIVGDLNAHASVLIHYLQSLGLIDRGHHWAGGKAVLVQMGDIPNRGPGARVAMELLLRLRAEARDAGGDVVWMLGNHEVLAALGHEAYVVPDEYLEFAEPLELEAFERARSRYLHSLIGSRGERVQILPIGGRMRVWEEENAPGRAAYRRAMGPSGKLGRAIRRLPIALRLGPLLLVHGGLSPRWASHGLEGLARLARQAWAAKPQYYDDLDPDGILRDPMGALWHRAYCLDDGAEVASDLSEALRLLGARRMVVGHTRSDAAPEGTLGQPLLRHGGRLVMTDVGLGDPGEIGSVLMIKQGRMEAWAPAGAKRSLGRVGRG